MPSRCWKLSAPLIGLFIVGAPVMADEVDPAFTTAMNCTIVAATVYAQTLSNETAASVSRIAQSRCQSEWQAAEVANASKTIGVVQGATKRQLTPAEIQSLMAEPSYPRMVTPEIERRVADWRSQAAISGPSIYSQVREQYLAKAH